MYVYLSKGHIFDLLTVLIVNIGKVDSRKKNMSSLESADADILGHLLCHSCQRYQKREPIRMCQQGHNMCNRCKNHMSPFLFCTAQSSDLRNVNLEAIAAALIHPCPFEKLVASNCDSAFFPIDIAQHVRQSHSSECWEGTEGSEWMQLPVTFVQYQKAVFRLNKLFFLLWSKNADWLSFIVFHVGHENDSSGYIYDFKIENGLPLISSYGSTCHHYLQDGNEVMQSGKNVLLHLKSIKSLLDRPDVTCSLKIRRPQPIEGNEPIDRYQAGSSDFVPDIF